MTVIDYCHYLQYQQLSETVEEQHHGSCQFVYRFLYLCVYIKNSLTYKLMILFTHTVIFYIYIYIITILMYIYTHIILFTHICNCKKIFYIISTYSLYFITRIVLFYTYFLSKCINIRIYIYFIYCPFLLLKTYCIILLRGHRVLILYL